MTLPPRSAALALLAALTLTILGCASRPPLLEGEPTRVELAETPFFAQQQLQCGPAALATVLSASGVPVTPAQLEPRLFVPGRGGSLQIEMQAAPRAFARLAYQLDPELHSIIGELRAGRPVVVLHNYGLPLWPRWHYAVVVGYDGPGDRIVMRSGATQRMEWSAARFMRAWDNGGRWALVMLSPGELPEAVNRQRYLEMVAAFEKVAEPALAERAFAAATRSWPTDSSAWIGLGNSQYRQSRLQDARASYAAALDNDPTLLAARNNLAMTMIGLGCPRSAERLLRDVRTDAVREPMQSALLDTRSRIGQGSDSADCVSQQDAPP